MESDGTILIGAEGLALDVEILSKGTEVVETSFKKVTVSFRNRGFWYKSNPCLQCAGFW